MEQSSRVKIVNPLPLGMVIRNINFTELSRLEQSLRVKIGRFLDHP